MSAVAEAAATLRRGGLVVYPTETVYGIGTALSAGDAGGARVRAAKGSPAGRPFLLLAASTEASLALWSEVPPWARELAAEAWPGPLTLVGPAREGLPACVTGTAADGRASLAVRVPG
ncbi:MAG: Sua5/YciO/YrdC/YwlC family protein, partial [Myxococcota bacterium]|nr:Sua5/YciO/YrdC/YwlC family protein [Myxococcota bacterium]